MFSRKPVINEELDAQVALTPLSLACFPKFLKFFSKRRVISFKLIFLISPYIHPFGTRSLVVTLFCSTFRFGGTGHWCGRRLGDDSHH